MTDTYQRRQRGGGVTEGGFTLIELLIVIVVLGILAAVVIFALGGITSKSAVAACQADGATVSTAIAALEAEYPGTTLTQAALTSTSVNATSAYIQSWPNNTAHYSFTVSGTSTAGLNIAVVGGYSGQYLGPSSCNSVK